MEEDLRESAVPAAESVAAHLHSIDIADATPLAAQEADLCIVHSTPQIGNDGDPHWLCSVYAIQVLESATDDLEILRTTISTGVAEAGFGDVIYRHATGPDQLSPGDSATLARGPIGENHWLEVQVGRDVMNISSLLHSIGKPERLIGSSGDEVLSVPSRTAEPITCDCLQIWIVISKNYGSAPAHPREWEDWSEQ